jgi:hypothetical protein
VGTLILTKSALNNFLFSTDPNLKNMFRGMLGGSLIFYWFLGIELFLLALQFEQKVDVYTISSPQYWHAVWSIVVLCVFCGCCFVFGSKRSSVGKCLKSLSQVEKVGRQA